jgi:hypothetical protein
MSKKYVPAQDAGWNAIVVEAVTRPGWDFLDTS